MNRKELIEELERRGKSSRRAYVRAMPDKLLEELLMCAIAESLRRRRTKTIVPQTPYELP
jgi:hypothetical protein